MYHRRMMHTKIELLAVADVARIIDRTPATVRAVVARGRLTPRAITPRGVRLFAREDVENYLAMRDRLSIVRGERRDG